MKIKGIKQGKIIEVSEELKIPDGKEIIIEIQEAQLMSQEERRKRLHELFNNWEGKHEFVEILSEIDRENHGSTEEEVSVHKLIELVINGKEVTIASDDKPVVKLVLVPPVTKRWPAKAGSAKGLVTLSADFEEPIADFEEYLQ